MTLLITWLSLLSSDQKAVLSLPSDCCEPKSKVLQEKYNLTPLYWWTEFMFLLATV